MSKTFAETSPRTWRGLLAVLICALMLGGCLKRLDKTTGEAGGDAPATAPLPPTLGAAQNTWNLALQAMQQQNWSTAQPLLALLVKDYPELPGPAVNLGIVQARLQQPEARATLTAAATRYPKFAPAQHQLGRYLVEQGAFAEADAAYARAEALDPRNAVIAYDRGVLNELYLQRPEVALREYESYQRLLPEPDKQVAAWITALRRQAPAARPAGAGS